MSDSNSGPLSVILFEFSGCEFMADGRAAVDEVRIAQAWYHFAAGPRLMEFAQSWCAEIVDLMKTHGGGNRRLAIDKMDPTGTHLLEAANIEIVDGFEVAHMARLIKTPQEIDAVRQSIDVCQEGVRRMIAATKPGMTENAIWSILHQTNIELGGEWIETRLLNSGPRTNPWYQEASERVVEEGDMICVDTDLIGPHGYGADLSRSWTVGDKKPQGEQRRLYALAHEQVLQNWQLFMPERSFFELADLAYRMPEKYKAFEQPAIAHGSGLCNEFPLLIHSDKIRAKGHDGILEPGMVICVESYAGAPGDPEGVKLEQQILITESGPGVYNSVVRLMPDISSHFSDNYRQTSGGHLPRVGFPCFLELTGNLTGNIFFFDAWERLNLFKCPRFIGVF
ncbi:M24 family metallopeptidase [Planktomarina sp.]|nr:M24 family metallopeptidase [Planktomarina sp.]